ncbi:MAG: hypothetical protein AAF990_07545 [Bacteroidota bacterium]
MLTIKLFSTSVLASLLLLIGFTNGEETNAVKAELKEYGATYLAAIDNADVVASFEETIGEGTTIHRIALHENAANFIYELEGISASGEAFTKLAVVGKDLMGSDFNYLSSAPCKCWKDGMEFVNPNKPIFGCQYCNVIGPR